MVNVELGGRKTWGNLAWGAAYSVLPTGLQTTISLGTAVAKAGAKATVSNNLITSGFGVVDIEADATFVHTHAPQINSAVGTPIVSDNEFVVSYRSINNFCNWNCRCCFRYNCKT